MTEEAGAEDETTYNLIIAFDTDDDEFIRGFEIGSLYECVRPLAEVQTDEPFRRQIHASNIEMALRIAEYADLSMRIEPYDDEDWVDVVFSVKADAK